MSHEICAKKEADVRKLYQDEDVAQDYIEDRFTWSWSRLLHDKQVSVLNDLVAQQNVESVLELAPGPARLTADLRGVKRGLMVEGSEQMVEVAKKRLVAAGLDNTWELRCGNAFELEECPTDFDCVFTFRFIRHFETKDRQRLYEQILARLKPGGFLVFDAVNKVIRDGLDQQGATDESGETAKSDASDNSSEGAEELDVYDVTYTKPELESELRDAGFEPVALHEVVRHMNAQSWCSHKFDRRCAPLSRALVSFLAAIPPAHPLEWVVVCRKPS